MNYCQELRLAGHVQGVRESHGADIVDVHTHVCVHDDLRRGGGRCRSKGDDGKKGRKQLYFFVSIFPLKLELTRIFARIFRLFADSLISFYENARPGGIRNER